MNPPEAIIADTPSHQDVERLVSLFNQQLFAEVEPLARAMTERFPQTGFGWKVLASTVKRLGHTEESLHYFCKAIELSPWDAEAHINLGNTFQDLGRQQDAEASYRRALAINPQSADAWVNLGRTLTALGNLAEAQTCCHQALELAPGNARAHNNLGNVLKSLGQLPQAEQSYREALRIDPNFADAHSNLGGTLHDLGKLAQAEASCRRAVQIKPGDPNAQNNLGTALRSLHRLDEAEQCYLQALKLRPDFADALSNLGATYQELGRLPEAEVSLRRALALQPNDTETLNNYAIVLQGLGRLHDAQACCRRALQIRPDFAAMHNVLGNVLKDLGSLDEAIQSYRRALDFDPEFADALNNLGVALHRSGQPHDALAHFRRALNIRPDYAQALNNLGNTLKDLGRFDESEQAYHHALRSDPQFEDAHSNLLFMLNYHPDKSAEQIFTWYERYDEQFGLPLRTALQPHGNPSATGRKLKIGYVSPDFRQHACRYFLEPLLARHDRTAFEIHAYAELTRPDATSALYQNLVDHWIPTRGMSDEVLAKRIRDDGIDILVDLAGHTAANRLRVFARKPAPVSLSWLGFGYTTGLSAIDYFLTDAHSAPDGSAPLFSEAPWRLNGPALVYRPASGMGEVGPLPAQQNGFITFGTLTRAVRINHRTRQVWAEILRRVPASRLVVDSTDFRSTDAREALLGQFVDHGIAADRIQIGFHSPPWDILRSIDVTLDCFPHNSGTTLFESLYMGVPFVTLAGRPSVGCLGSAILHGAGHGKWVATSEEDYVNLACQLATDRDQLVVIRAGLRSAMQNSPLMDEAGFARRVETAYFAMWRRWLGQQHPPSTTHCPPEGTHGHQSE
jgi:predicted O-linked N-acetylglucosamine transferase (SPINDLY family)